MKGEKNSCHGPSAAWHQAGRHPGRKIIIIVLQKQKHWHPRTNSRASLQCTIFFFWHYIIMLECWGIRNALIINSAIKKRRATQLEAETIII